MLTVSHCFRCVDLKQGFLTYTIISLIHRIFLVCTICYVTISLFSILRYQQQQEGFVILAIVGSLLLWCVLTLMFLGIAIKGMMQGRSSLLKPYFAVVIIETIARAIVLLLSFVYFTGFFNCIILIILICFDVYHWICLYSLFVKMRAYERCPTVAVYQNSRPPMPPMYQPSGGNRYPGPPQQNFYTVPSNAIGTQGSPAQV
ncbi:hypothetical protein ILUMI_13328 [Ignelater luminosus]|uniref:Uncharacterized protein n=1 Tax=Ignelater luminosus TaxID=2038154 RepID=A0A8K0GC33_IGNLU|nr:hypothetical protein ILUMI_13328 [Ignelater luminosus]